MINCKYLILITIAIFLCNITYSQPKDFKYYKYSYVVIPKQDSFYLKNDFVASIKFNLIQVDSLGNVVNPHNYVIAQDYAQLKMIDSAFYFLEKYIDIPKDYRSVFVEPDFEILRQYKVKWQIIEEKINNFFLMELDSGHNKEFALKLFHLAIEESKYSFASIFKDDKTISFKQDIKNQRDIKKKYKKLVRKYGFPTPSLVGKSASMFAFYILQHSLIENKYYTMAKKAYEKGDYNPEFYALLTDRYLVQNNKKQIFGTQFSKTPEQTEFILNEVEDFKNLNKRRAELGLSTIEEYAKKINGIIPEEYY